MSMVEEVTFPETVAFLERYKLFTTETAALRVRTFHVGFAQFKVAMEAIKKLGRALERQQAPRFNLFQLLRVTRNERWTHSAFLRELLDPEGCHGQGHLFLETFSSIAGRKQGSKSFQGLPRS
jgi:PD-(D/E)XK nuclease superfamily